MLVHLKRPMWYTLAPLCFLMVMTVVALVLQLRTFYQQGNFFLLFLGVVVLIAAILVAMESGAALKRHRALAAAEDSNAS